MVRVEFKKLYKDSILPKKAHESDAGFDLYAHDTGIKGFNFVEGISLAPGQRVLIKCGFGMAIPVGFEGQVRPRSGLALKNGISVVNSPGTIDAGYRNEVGVILINHGDEPFNIRPGDRIAQLVIQKLPDVEVVEVEELSNPSERGQAGFGSTGVG
jgi:dUTP pyrophosphatase